MAVEKPTFILGVGAQKSGTTWLHTQLAKSPTIDFGFRKEYHVWDAVYNEIHKYPRSNNKQATELNQTLFRLMQRNEGVYESYFRDLIHDGVTTTGDFTPSYSMLTADALTEIKSRLESAGFAVKVVFIMRDPVARVWSAYKMVQKAQSMDGRANSFENFATYMRHSTTEARTRYDYTVRALRSSFDEDELFIGFYETLFNPDTHSRLADFLRIDPKVFDSSARINTSAADTMPNADFRACRAFYSDVYDFCNQEFPETKRLWIKLPLSLRIKKAAQALLRGHKRET